jgi:hypothetical protein
MKYIKIYDYQRTRLVRLLYLSQFKKLTDRELKDLNRISLQLGGN